MVGSSVMASVEYLYKHDPRQNHTLHMSSSKRKNTATSTAASKRIKYVTNPYLVGARDPLVFETEQPTEGIFSLPDELLSTILLRTLLKDPVSVLNLCSGSRYAYGYCSNRTVNPEYLPQLAKLKFGRRGLSVLDAAKMLVPFRDAKKCLLFGWMLNQVSQMLFNPRMLNRIDFPLVDRNDLLLWASSGPKRLCEIGSLITKTPTSKKSNFWDTVSTFTDPLPHTMWDRSYLYDLGRFETVGDLLDHHAIPLWGTVVREDQEVSPVFQFPPDQKQLGDLMLITTDMLNGNQTLLVEYIESREFRSLVDRVVNNKISKALADAWQVFPSTRYCESLNFTDYFDLDLYIQNRPPSVAVWGTVRPKRSDILDYGINYWPEL